MVDVYSKMNPDSFTSQLQTTLTAYYEDIKGVQGSSGCPKSKVVKRMFEDQEDAGLAQKAAPARAADADASDADADAAPVTLPDGGPAAAAEEAPRAVPSPAGVQSGHLDSCRHTMSYVRRTTSYNTDVAHDVVRHARTTSYPYAAYRASRTTSYIDVVRQARTTSQHTMS
jgi:hypothetical protein